jgi:hypothetical protein
MRYSVLRERPFALRSTMARRGRSMTTIPSPMTPQRRSWTGAEFA